MERLDSKKIKFMEWGIINKYNFKDIYDIPIKRWDPLSTVTIHSKDFGFRKERKRYYGHYAYLSPIRARRPKNIENIEKIIEQIRCSDESMAAIKDIFMTITEGKVIKDDRGNPLGDGYTVVIAEDEKIIDNPFTAIPRKVVKVDESVKALTLINRYPAMCRIIDENLEARIKKKLPPHLKLARGINLLTISRHFYPSRCFHLIPVDVLTGIFLSMKTTILHCVQEAIDRDFYDIPVSPFFNIGIKAGGSQPRIHGQVYIDLNMDGHGNRLEGYLKAFKEMGDNCHLCETTHGNSDRIIMKTPYWIWYTTGSPVRNYHIRFHPKEHVRRFSQLNINQFRDLSDGLKKISIALDSLNIDPNRNILFNNCPFGYDANFHLFGDLIPHEIIGGAELADDMRVARMPPHRAAREIREALNDLEKGRLLF
ncbi:MAG: hypothetical protein ACTSXH_09710 [Promethearchaeota archaeon]